MRGVDYSPARALASHQHGLLARRQLLRLGYDADHVRNQVRAGRWVERTPVVVSTFTGPLDWPARVWLGVLHAGDGAVVGGLSALEWRGLRGWHRDDVTVLVDDRHGLDPVDGVVFARSRRPLPELSDRRSVLPSLSTEAAALLFAGYERSSRTALGLVAAVVQQRLSTPRALREQLDAMRPLRRAADLRVALGEFEGGAQSLAELDVARLCRRFRLPRPHRQTRRRDSAGRWRFTDCEWRLPGGMVLVLEVDGAFHMEVSSWEDDLARHRRLVTPGRMVVRCSARELRDEPDLVVADLLALGLPRSCG